MNSVERPVCQDSVSELDICLWTAALPPSLLAKVLTISVVPSSSSGNKLLIRKWFSGKLVEVRKTGKLKFLQNSPPQGVDPLSMNDTLR